jgi:hypothetical protein
VVHEAHAYWRSKLKQDRLPTRRDIDPVEIPKLLPHVQLTEICMEPFAVRHRLVGTALMDIYGHDYTGAYLSREDEGDDGYDYDVDVYRRLWRDKVPVFGRDNVYIRGRRHIMYEWVELPLVDHSGSVTMSFAVGELYKPPLAGPLEVAPIGSSAPP